jgi:hypothetical protein
MLWNPTNADAVSQLLGMIVRSGPPGSVLLAKADSSEGSANLVGTRLSDVASGSTGLIQSFSQSTVVRMVSEPSVNDIVYLSDVVDGCGTVDPPSLPVPLGICYEKAQVSGTWYATLIDVLNVLSPSTAIATWDPNVVRHFFVNQSTGSDSNRGWLDAATSAASVDPTGLPVQTLAKLRQIVPRGGCGRLAIIHIANVDHSAGTQYAETLDLTGFGGYQYFLKRAWTAWLVGAGSECWGQLDRDIAGARVAIAGPNPDSTFTVATATDVHPNTGQPVPLYMTVAAGGASLASEASTLYRVRFTGNVTVELAGMRACVGASGVDYLQCTDPAQDNNFDTATPAPGDTFWIERPGVTIDRYLETTGPTSLVAINFGAVSANLTVGLSFLGTQTVPSRIGSSTTSVWYSFCESPSTTDRVVIASGPMGQLDFTASWRNPLGGAELSFCGFRFAGGFTAAGLLRATWCTQSGCVKPPGAEKSHGNFSMGGIDIYGTGGIFLGGLTLNAQRALVGNNSDDEFYDMFTRIVRVFEIIHATASAPANVELYGIDLDNAVLKIGDAQPQRAGLMLQVGTVRGGPTGADCISTTGIYVRAAAKATIMLASPNVGGSLTLTGAGGDISNNGSILTYAQLAQQDLVDTQGNHWIGATDVASAGHPRAGSSLTNSDSTIAPGTDKRSLYILPPVLTANHQVTVDPTSMAPKQVVCLRLRDLSANTYAIIDGGPGTPVLYTRPASPGVVIDAWVKLNDAGTNVVLDEVVYKDA